MDSIRVSISELMDKIKEMTNDGYTTLELEVLVNEGDKKLKLGTVDIENDIIKSYGDLEHSDCYI